MIAEPVATQPVTAEPVATEPLQEVAAEPPRPVVVDSAEPAQPVVVDGAQLATPVRKGRPLWPWLVGLLLACAFIGGALGASLGLRQGGPLVNQNPTGARPTIVVATPAVVASVAASPAVSPGLVPTALAAPQPQQQPARTYVVQPGDTLRSIAQDQYGDPTVWPRIYETNRDIIGPDPDALVAGTELRLPAEGQ